MKQFNTLEEMFTDENRWVKFYSAQTSDGFGIDPNDPTAAAWCLWGGILHIAADNAETVRRLSGIIYDRIKAMKIAKLYPIVTLARAGGSFAVSEYINIVNDHESITIEDIRHLVKEI